MTVTSGEMSSNTDYKDKLSQDENDAARDSEIPSMIQKNEVKLH